MNIKKTKKNKGNKEDYIRLKLITNGKEIKRIDNNDNPPQLLDIGNMTYEEIQNETKNHVESIKMACVTNKCSKCPKKLPYNILIDDIPSYEMYCGKCNSYYQLCSKCYDKNWIKCPSCKKEMQNLSI